MSGKDTVPVRLAALPRENPMVWQDEDTPTGVFLDAEPGDGLHLMGTPTMQLQAGPRLPDDFEASDALRKWFRELHSALADAAAGHASRRLDIHGIDSQSHQAIIEILGTGEVTGSVDLDGVKWTVQEAVLTGVWLVRGDDGSEWVEAAEIPSVIRDAASSLASAPLRLPDNPPDVMNGVAVLAEISDRAASWESGPNHVMNFTLLPMSTGDQNLLTSVLGRAALTLESGGFGDCRIMATMIRHVWAVQYLNAMGKTILDTIEIGDVPAAARAAREDFEDSSERLEEILAAYLT